MESSSRAGLPFALLGSGDASGRQTQSEGQRSQADGRDTGGERERERERERRAVILCVVCVPLESNKKELRRIESTDFFRGFCAASGHETYHRTRRSPAASQRNACFGRGASHIARRAALDVASLCPVPRGHLPHRLRSLGVPRSESRSGPVSSSTDTVSSSTRPVSAAGVVLAAGRVVCHWRRHRHIRDLPEYARMVLRRRNQHRVHRLLGECNRGRGELADRRLPTVTSHSATTPSSRLPDEHGAHGVYPQRRRGHSD